MVGINCPSPDMAIAVLWNILSTSQLSYFHVFELHPKGDEDQLLALCPHRPHGRHRQALASLAHTKVLVPVLDQHELLPCLLPIVFASIINALRVYTVEMKGLHFDIFLSLYSNSMREHGAIKLSNAKILTPYPLCLPPPETGLPYSANRQSKGS